MSVEAEVMVIEGWFLVLLLGVHYYRHNDLGASEREEGDVRLIKRSLEALSRLTRHHREAEDNHDYR